MGDSVADGPARGRKDGLTWDSAAVEARVGALIAAASEAGIGVSFVSMAGAARVVYVSDKGVEILGRPRAEIVGRPAAELLTPRARDASDSLGRGRPLEERARFFETTIARADGREVPVEVSLAPIELDGRPGVVAFTRDITERRAAVEALAQSEQRFRRLIELAPDAVWINDGRRLVFANPAAARMLRYADVAALLAADPSEFFTPEDRASMRARTQRMLETRQPLPPREYNTRRNDGSWVLTEVHSMPVEWDGKPAILGFARDVTARKEIEARLVQSERLAALGTLLAGIAHEMNNPLSYTLLGIEQAVEALAELELPRLASAKLREALDGAHEGATRVAAVIGQIRATSRPEAEDRGPVALRAVLESALRVTQNELHHRARLVTDFADVPPLIGSAQRLEQVFLNLLVNAVQALPDGRTDNEIRVALRTSPAGEVVVEVSDNGVGIPEEARSRIFDPFFTTKAVGRGTGLGLALVDAIVRRATGRVAVDSTVGEGTTFHVHLPRVAADADRPAGAVATAPDVKDNGTVLLVDDEPDVRRVSRRILQRGGYTVVEAGGGAEAIAITRDMNNVVDILVTDMMMPGVSGRDVIDVFRQLRPRVPILCVTGFAAVGQDDATLAASVHAIVEKPFTAAALTNTVADALRAAGRT
jgi:PAS domain S-box-containing protein